MASHETLKSRCAQVTVRSSHGAPSYLRSRHQMLRLACRPMLDIIDQLIGKKLHGAVRGPRDMRREDEIGAPHIEQRMAISGRLDRQHVEACARDQPFIERLYQRRLIDQSAAGGVDE